MEKIIPKDNFIQKCVQQNILFTDTLLRYEIICLSKEEDSTILFTGSTLCDLAILQAVCDELKVL